jgi:hypothetical protein
MPGLKMGEIKSPADAVCAAIMAERRGSHG